MSSPNSLAYDGDSDATPLRSLVAFLAITFLVAWSLWLVAGVVLARTNVTAGRAMLFLPGTFAPAMAALWMAHRSGGRSMAGETLARAFQWRARARWYVFAVSYMLAVKLLAAGLYRVHSGEWPEFGATPILFMLLATAFSAPFQIGEELGWRGYALPRLARAVGFGSAGLILGMIWALWHLPLFLIDGTDSSGQPFVPFFLAVTALSVAITWLYVNTNGSLVPVMVMHAAINNTTGIVPTAAASAPGTLSLHASTVAWFTVLVLWAGAAYFLLRMSTRATELNRTA